MIGKMLGRAIGMAAKTAAKSAAKGGYSGRFVSSGRYLFVPHPNCCKRCNLLGLTPHFYSTPDVAFITHPNCLCATVEVPAGLSPSEVMEWAKAPVGRMSYGFNYGVAVRTVDLQEANRAAVMEMFRRDAQLKLRSVATRYRINKVRTQVREGTLGPAKDFTRTMKRLSTAEANRKAKAKLSMGTKGKLGKNAKSAIAKSQKGRKMKQRDKVAEYLSAFAKTAATERERAKTKKPQTLAEKLRAQAQKRWNSRKGGLR